MWWVVSRISTTIQALPVDGRTLTDQVVRHLRRQIMVGELAAGQRLGEVSLAEQLAVSRSTVREAFRRLEGEYLIESVSHRGSRVACLTPADAAEVCALHAMLETHCIERLTIPISSRLRRQLIDITDEMRKLTYPNDVDVFIELDHAFHKLIVDAADQRLISHVWSSINALVGVIITLSIRLMQLDANVIADRHVAIIDALSNADGLADTALRTVEDHYESLARRFLEESSK